MTLPTNRTQMIGISGDGEKQLHDAILQFKFAFPTAKVSSTPTGLWLPTGWRDGRDLLLICPVVRRSADYGTKEVTFIARSNEFRQLMEQICDHQVDLMIMQLEGQDLVPGLGHLIFTYIHEGETVQLRLEIVQAMLYSPPA